mgnify:CR=1 FL=1
MSYDYSENILVQKSTRRLWELELKWEYPLGAQKDGFSFKRRKLKHKEVSYSGERSDFVPP